MQKKILLTIIFGFCMLSFLNAQQIQISGTVRDENNQSPLPGATIAVKGTSNGTISDVNGNYSIVVTSSSSELVFSFIGYITEYQTVGDRTVIDINLVPDLLSLGEVIIVAYGVASKEAATGSVNVLKTEDLNRAIVTSPEKALQGKVAGVQINNYSGQPGGGTEIYIRGISSLNSGNQPLYVIDGVPVISGNYGYSTTNSNVMSSIDPSDIESMTVLKDAAAASVYGSRAANGVILITTKSGKEGKTKFELNSKYGVSKLAKSGDYRFMTSEELLAYHRVAITNAGFNPDNRFDPQHYYPETLLDAKQTNWFDEVFRTGNIKSIDLSASGGSEKTNFYMSGGFYTEEGIMIGSDMKRFSFTLNVDHKASDRITIGNKMKASYSKVSDLPQELYWASPIYAAQNLLPWQNAYNEDGSINWNVPSNWNYNPVGIAQVNDQWDKFYRVINSTYLEWKIIENLKFKTDNSIDYMDSEGRNYNSPKMPDGAGVNGQVWNGLTKNYSLLSSNTLDYDLDVNENNRFHIMGGQEVQYTNFSQYDLNAKGIGSQVPYISNTTIGLKNINYYLTETSLVSFFGILNYSYNNKYIFSASLRSDGCSRFSPEHRWGKFYSVGASWNLHNESFIKDLNSISYLKLRSSYGTNGNYNIGDYKYYGTYGTNEYNNSASSLPNRLPNNDLTWEKNNELNIGLDATIFKKLTVNVDWYNRITSDMLLEVQLPTTTGFGSQLRNTGKLSNTGIELNLDYNILKSNDFDLNIGFNVAHNKTKLLDLGGEKEILDGWNRIHRLNETFSQWYVYDWAGVNPLTGMGMWYDEDGKLTERYENARRVTKGQIQPKYVGGFTLNTRWKGLSLNVLFEFKTGHYVYIMESTYTKSDGWYIGHNQVASQLDYWKKPGDVVANPKPIANNTSNSNAWKSSRWIEKGDYLRFKQINLTYSLPKNLISSLAFNSVDIYVEGANLYAWHNVSYWDPERSYDGDIYSSYPMSKQLIFGIRLGL